MPATVTNATADAGSIRWCVGTCSSWPGRQHDYDDRIVRRRLAEDARAVEHGAGARPWTAPRASDRDEQRPIRPRSPPASTFQPSPWSSAQCGHCPEHEDQRMKPIYGLALTLPSTAVPAASSR